MEKWVRDSYTRQLSLNYPGIKIYKGLSKHETLAKLLTEDLDFHEYNGRYSTHNFHSFPAKFPPQLPSKFIHALTQKSDIVLDPMMGSGTTVLEAYLNDRQAVGFDIDPLAIMIVKVKTSNLKQDTLVKYFKSIIKEAKRKVSHEKKYLQEELIKRLNPKSKEFVDYWFASITQLEIMALLTEIEKISENEIRIFCEIALSATIITKTGGVSLALDLAHTRPHKAKVLFDQTNTIIFGEEFTKSPSTRLKFLTKKLRSTIDEFEKKSYQNYTALVNSSQGKIRPEIKFGDAQNLPLEELSVDLIVTSPPYASNAIDYMRAHKFSLIWFGYQIDELSLKRKEYIGSEDTAKTTFERLPPKTASIVSQVSKLDRRRGRVLQRYYSEMSRTIKEMYRVLKAGSVSVMVVGSSIMRGTDTETQNCLAEISEEIGFKEPIIGIRKLDRNKRMLPTGKDVNKESMIQQRMHEEYVIGLYKE